MTRIVPSAVPAEDGEKLVPMLTVCPAASVYGTFGLVTVKPFPSATTLEMVALPVPWFATIAARALLSPTFTSPKSTVDGVAESPFETEVLGVLPKPFPPQDNARNELTRSNASPTLARTRPEEKKFAHLFARGFLDTCTGILSLSVPPRLLD
ncbi:MAG: hypothetical protein M1404_07170 [Acidobacteria bacterium]|nr:hypothetical protein [Acidobacteriota bacterium]